MTLTAQFRCGHTGRLKDDAAPICPECGHYGVARVLNVPNPTIRGTATGPLVKTEALEPVMVMIGESRLSLKEETHGDE